MTGGARRLSTVVLGCALLAGCGRGGRPNVVLVVIDTARADRFTFDGYGRPTTPEIARLGAEGAVFLQAATPAPWTLPAHSSLFTGLYPSSHGADSGHLRLDDEFRTLAEGLRDAGYRTLAYVANPWAGRQYGLDQGFDTYEEFWKGKPADRKDAGAGEINDRVERFLAWRQDNPPAREQPFFIFINYLEPHLPYDPPEPWRSRFLAPGTDPAAVERLRRFKHPDEVKYVLGLGGLREGDLGILSDLYDGEISYVDGKVGELAGVLRSHGLLDDTVLVVTSDHGEAIGDHGFLDHKMNVFQELLRIPLVVRYPPAVAAGQRIEQPVMLQDLDPTLLALAGAPIESPAGGDGGREALALPGIRGLARPGRRSVPGRGGEAPPRGAPLSVSEFARPIQFLEIMKERFPDVHIAGWDRALVAYRSGSDKLHWASDGRHRLYDLARDPLETNDLATTEPEKVRTMASDVEAWLRRPGARDPYRLAAKPSAESRAR